MGELIRMYGPLALVLLAFYLVFRYLSGLFLPFMIAVAIAVLIDPLVSQMEKRLRLPRGVTVGITLVLLITIILFFLSVGIAHIATELRLLAADFPVYYVYLEQRLIQFSTLYAEWLASLPQALQDQIKQRQEEWVVSASGTLDSLGVSLQNLVLEGLPNLIAVLLVTFIATYFISRDRNTIKRFGLLLVPASRRDSVEKLAHRLFSSFVGFVNAYLILVLMTALITIIGLTLLGSRYALILGIAAGILDILPVIGPGLLFVPWAAYHFLFGNVIFGLLLLLLYGFNSAIRMVLEAQIIGRNVGLHPLTTLVSLYVGAKMLGPVGIIVGPLVAVIIKAMYETGILRLNNL